MKKNDAVKFRLTDDEKAKLIEIADHFGCGDLSSLIRVVCKRLIDSYKIPGMEVVWPLQFKMSSREPLELQTEYSYRVLGKHDEILVEESGKMSLTDHDIDFSDPDAYLDDDYFWTAVYKAVLSHVRCRVEGVCGDTKPSGIDVKIWSVMQKAEDENGRSLWVPITEPSVSKPSKKVATKRQSNKETL